MRYSRRTIATLAAVAPLALAFACKDSGRESAEGKAATDAMVVEQSGMASRVAPAPMAGEARSRREVNAYSVATPPPPMPASVMLDTSSAGPSQLGQTVTSATPPDAASAMIIRTGTATIKVDSLELAVARLRLLAQSLGGYVGNTSVQSGTDQMRSATVEIKVPSSRWTQLLAGIRPVGTLEQQDESAQDVGEEFVDVQARVANSRRLEERLITLLASRTGKLSDVLAVERELARVREEIERYEGRMRYLRTRSAISTMTVVVHEPGPVLGNQPGENPIADAFRNAWRLFVALVAFVISSLGVIVPLAIIVAGLVWWRRGRKAE